MGKKEKKGKKGKEAKGGDAGDGERGDEYKIVMVGAGGVGKSALTMRFIKGNFIERYDPTIEDSYKKDVEVEGVLYSLDILDTAGQEEYSALRDQYLKTGWGFVLVYSITDAGSFHNLEEFREAILRAKDATSIPSLVVGNKADLEEDRVVMFSEGQEFCKKYEYCEFIETSAKTKDNVEDMYFKIIATINTWFDDHPKMDLRKRKKGCVLC